MDYSGIHTLKPTLDKALLDGLILTFYSQKNDGLIPSSLFFRDERIHWSPEKPYTGWSKNGFSAIYCNRIAVRFTVKNLDIFSSLATKHRRKGVVPNTNPPSVSKRKLQSFLFSHYSLFLAAVFINR